VHCVSNQQSAVAQEAATWGTAGTASPTHLLVLHGHLLSQAAVLLAQARHLAFKKLRFTVLLLQLRLQVRPVSLQVVHLPACLVGCCLCCRQPAL
jgi:hypothetical protein